VKCKDCPFYREHRENFKRLMKETEQTIKDTEKFYGDDVYNGTKTNTD